MVTPGSREPCSHKKSGEILGQIGARTDVAARSVSTHLVVMLNDWKPYEPGPASSPALERHP